MNSVELLSVAFYGERFACALRRTGVDQIVSFSRSDQVISETTPQQVLRELLDSVGEISPKKILYTSGPGSYTGLRIGLSFVKALALSYEARAIGISLFELTYSYLLRELQVKTPLSVSIAVGREKALECTGMQCPDFDEKHWALRDLKAPGQPLPNLFCTSPDNTVLDVTSGNISAIPFERELILSFSSRNLENGTKSLFDLTSLALLEPQYGQAFHAKTVQEQKAHRKG